MPIKDLNALNAYTCISGQTQEELTKTVKSLRKYGWLPIGEPGTTTKGRHMQVLGHPENSPPLSEPAVHLFPKSFRQKPSQ